MTIQDVQSLIPDYGRDMRVNIENLLGEEATPGLTPAQQFVVALACAYSLANKTLIDLVLEQGKAHLNDATREAAKSAATIMAMNNVYYRGQHLMDDPGIKALPARLRMSVIGRPGVEKADFELMCYAVSAIAGCGQCLTAHAHEVRKQGLSDEAVQSALRLASVLTGTDKALQIREL